MGAKRVTASRHAGRRNRGELTRDDVNEVGGRDEIRRFWPSPAHLRYRNKVLAALQSGHAVSDTAICDGLAMSRQTVWEWRQDPSFLAWLRVSLDTDQSLEMRCAISRHLHLAIEGSTRSLLVLAKLKAMGVF